jgi:hypothetical protein
VDHKRSRLGFCRDETIPFDTFRSSLNITDLRAGGGGHKQ